MARRGEGAEKLNEVLRVLLEFIGSVRVNKPSGGRGCIPGNDPVPVSLDCFGRLGAAKGKLETSKCGCGFVICNGRERASEDGVKIDRCPDKHILPFGFREGRDRSGSEEGPQGMLDVSSVVSDHLEGVLKGW